MPRAKKGPTTISCRVEINVLDMNKITAEGIFEQIPYVLSVYLEHYCGSVGAPKIGKISTLYRGKTIASNDRDDDDWSR